MRTHKQVYIEILNCILDKGLAGKTHIITECNLTPNGNHIKTLLHHKRIRIHRIYEYGSHCSKIEYRRYTITREGIKYIQENTQ